MNRKLLSNRLLIFFCIIALIIPRKSHAQSTGVCGTVSPCDLVQNGDFENNSGCGSTLNSATLASCWLANSLSPDLFVRGCTSSTPSANLGTNTYSSSIIFDSHNGSPNNAVLGVGGAVGIYSELNLSESIANYLGSPILNNQVYTLSFWAYQFVGSKSDPDFSDSTGYPAQVFNTSSVSAVLSFATHSVTIPYLAQNYPDTVLTVIQSLTLANTFNAWKQYAVTFTATGINSGNWLYIGMDKSLTYTYASYTLGASVLPGYFFYTLIDDVSLKPGAFVPMITSNRPTTICKGENITLSAQQGANTYVWMPANAYSQTVSVSPAATTIYTVSTTSFTNGFQCNEKKTIQIVVSPCTADEEWIATKKGFVVFPNPNEGNFTVEFKQNRAREIKIYNKSGQSIRTITFEAGNRSELVITDLDPGFYLVESEGYHSKLIISK